MTKKLGEILIQKSQFSSYHSQQTSNHSSNDHISNNSQNTSNKIQNELKIVDTHQTTSQQTERQGNSPFPNTFSILEGNIIQNSTHTIPYTAYELNFLLSLFRQINVEWNGTTTEQFENSSINIYQSANTENQNGNIDQNEQTKQNMNTENKDTVNSNKLLMGYSSQNNTIFDKQINNSDKTIHDSNLLSQHKEGSPLNRSRSPENKNLPPSKWRCEENPLYSQTPIHQQPFDFQGIRYHLINLTPVQSIWTSKKRDNVLICFNMRYFVYCLIFGEARFSRLEQLLGHGINQVSAIKAKLGT